MSNINDNKKLWHRLNPAVGGGSTAWRKYLDSSGFSGGSVVEDTKAMLLDGGHWVGNMQESLDNYYSPELLSNGGFTTDLSGWVSTNWTWSFGAALHTEGFTTPLTQGGLTIGKVYKIVYEVTGRTAGSITVKAGSGSAGTANVTDGVFTEVLTATGSTLLLLTPTSDFDGAINYVTVKETI